MAERKRRRRTRAPEAVEEVQATATPPRRRRRPTAPVRKPDVRPIFRIATDIVNHTFSTGKAFPFEREKHKLYQEWRELFCLCTGGDKHIQFGMNSEPIKEWTGVEVVKNFTEGTKHVRDSRFQQLREELEKHLVVL